MIVCSSLVIALISLRNESSPRLILHFSVVCLTWQTWIKIRKVFEFCLKLEYDSCSTRENKRRKSATEDYLHSCDSACMTFILFSITSHLSRPFLPAPRISKLLMSSVFISGSFLVGGRCNRKWLLHLATLETGEGTGSDWAMSGGLFEWTFSDATRCLEMRVACT